MPMPAGTIAFTNGSAAVTGTDTTFTTDVAATDFIVVVAGGTSYMVGVTSVESDTGLTLVRNFDGPTTDGLTYRVVPVQTMQLITSQLSADTARAFRGFNLDKANWQAVLSGTGDVTVTLPDGTTYSGPSWGNIITTLNGKAANGSNSDITSLSGLTTALSIAQGGTGAKTAEAARTALGVAYGTASGTVAQGNDSRITGALQTSGGTMTGQIASTYTSQGFYKGSGGWNSGATANTITKAIGSDTAISTTSDLYLSSGNYWAYRVYIANSGDSSINVWEFRLDGTLRCPGAVYASGAALTSDSRLKFNKKFIDTPLEKVLTLRGMTYDFDGVKKTGIIAQDAQEILDGAVETNTDKIVLSTGEILDSTLCLDYGSVTAALTESIKSIIPLMLECLNDPDSAKSKLNSLVTLINTSNADENATDTAVTYDYFNRPSTRSGEETTTELGS